MDAVQILFLAVIQGVTEFLPISSSAHLILPAYLTDWPDQGLTFDVAAHVGTLCAVLTYFRRELADCMRGGLLLVTRGTLNEAGTMLLMIMAATMPMVAAGLAMTSVVETQLRSLAVIASTTIGFGLLLWLADRNVGEGSRPTWRQALLIGCAQVLALVPGTSRSGITITAALMLGLSRKAAAHFSFLLSIPAIAGAALLRTVDAIEAGERTNWGELAAGCLIAGLSAYTVIHFFMQLIERTGMTPYVIYRLALGALLIAFLWL